MLQDSELRPLTIIKQYSFIRDPVILVGSIEKDLGRGGTTAGHSVDNHALPDTGVWRTPNLTERYRTYSTSWHVLLVLLGLLLYVRMPSKRCKARDGGDTR